MPRKDHWDAVYTTKANDEVSWFEADPTISLDLIQQVSPPPSSVIDVGGGQSFLVDRLLDSGIDQIAILDISSVAISRTKERLGERAASVEWIEGDITSISNVGTFDLWHDRAVFHFLTERKDREAYLELAVKSIPVGGHMIIGTFGTDGPEKCSGLPVCRYDADSMASTLGNRFMLVSSQNHVHATPWGKEQHFFFGVFQRV
ncbi:MAG TPA: SAM-dependent methyltransferase [Planctomycetaceae bacterium]|nr:SAM-dependent methyltransferase [Planctomycetaceae bacterium]